MSFYLSLFKALNGAGVRYVVVGGLATVLHGYARNPVVSVDLFVYEPVPFHQLVLRGKRMDIEGTMIPVCSIDDLIDLKMRSARPRDLDDIEHLREIQHSKKIGNSDETEGKEPSRGE